MATNKKTRPMPDRHQIKAEIAKLKDLQDRVPEETESGESTGDAIDIQLQVLSSEIDENELENDHDNDDISDWEYEHGHEAFQWLMGESEQESLAAEWEKIATPKE